MIIGVSFAGVRAACGTENMAEIQTLRSTAELLNYSGGAWTRSAGSEYLSVINPATSERLASVPAGTKEDVDAVVRAAAAAYPGWRRTPPEDRIQYLFKLKQLLEDRVDDIARICTLENGKTLTESRAEMRRAIENVEVAWWNPHAHAGLQPGGRCFGHRRDQRSVSRWA